MNTLQIALNEMLTRLRGDIPLLNNTIFPKARTFKEATPGRAKSGKTRRGAKHKVGKSFKPRYVTTLRDKLGLPYNVTPAQYRHMHLGAKKVSG